MARARIVAVLVLIVGSALGAAEANAGYGVRYIAGTSSNCCGARADIEAPGSSFTESSGSAVAVDVGGQIGFGSNPSYIEIGTAEQNAGTILSQTCSGSTSNRVFYFAAKKDVVDGGSTCLWLGNAGSSATHNFKIAFGGTYWVGQTDNTTQLALGPDNDPAAQYLWAGGRTWGSGNFKMWGGIGGSGRIPYQIRDSAGNYTTVVHGTVCNGSIIDPFCSTSQTSPWAIDSINSTTHYWKVNEP